MYGIHASGDADRGLSSMSRDNVKHYVSLSVAGAQDFAVWRGSEWQLYLSRAFKTNCPLRCRRPGAIEPCRLVVIANSPIG